MDSSFQYVNSKSQIYIDESSISIQIITDIKSFSLLSTNSEIIKTKTKNSAFFSPTLYSIQCSTPLPLDTFNGLINKTGKKSKNISTGAIIGIDCAIIIMLVSVILAIFLIKRNKNKNNHENPESPPYPPNTKETEPAEIINTYIDSEEADINFWI